MKKNTNFLLCNYIWVDNENENTKYSVLDSILVGFWPVCQDGLLIENIKNGEQKEIVIGNQIGLNKFEIGSNILSEEIPDKFIVGQLIDKVILIENTY